MIAANPFAADPRGRGPKVAQWLLEQRIDVLITADDIRKKGLGYALGDAGIALIISDAVSLDVALTTSLGRQDLANRPMPVRTEEHKERDPRLGSQKE